MLGLFSTFLLSFGVFANPYFDPHVTQFSQSTRSMARTLPVLIVFKGGSLAENRIQLTIDLKRSTESQIARLRSSYDWAKSLEIKPLWIAQGAFTSLSSPQINALKQSDFVAGVYWSRKPYRVPRSEANLSFDRTQYTYGLTKLNVPQVRERFPQLLGKGVRIGVLDTGIAIQHPDLRGRLKVFRNFSPAQDPSPRDDFGHGTHVSGTIVGGAASGTAIGVAPQADLIVGRIFDGNGESTREMILNAMQWMADPDGDPHTNDYAQVVNSSWSDDEPFADRRPEDEPFCRIIDTWVKMNMIPVFSAGNTGPDVGTINIPAGCPQAFSVGATEQNDRSPHFSSTGPAVWKDLQLMKPEVSAPGFKIKSAERYGRYEEMSGTSMAAPHVSGAFALLLQAHPNASVEQIRRAMLEGAKDLGNPGQDAIFGYGRIDVLRSLEILGARQTN